MNDDGNETWRLVNEMDSHKQTRSDRNSSEMPDDDAADELSKPQEQKL